MICLLLELKEFFSISHRFIDQSEERLAAAQGGVQVAGVHSATLSLRHNEVGCQGNAEEEGQVEER